MNLDCQVCLVLSTLLIVADDSNQADLGSFLLWLATTGLLYRISRKIFGTQASKPVCFYQPTSCPNPDSQNMAISLLKSEDSTSSMKATMLTMTTQIEAKKEAGFDVTVVDPWGRLLSYSLLQGTDGGVSDRLSDLVTLSNFTSYEVPFPILTSVSVNASIAQCTLPTTASQYEFTPYEYGSWDAGIAAFANTVYMGTSMSAGLPVDSSNCIADYDNLGYILGTSSDVWVEYCVVPAASNDTLAGILSDIITDAESDLVYEDLTAIYPNPFYNLTTSPLVSSAETLNLVDGGISGQNVPIWPFVQNYRTVDVLIASDNSADTDYNWPNGTEIRQTYLNAIAAGLTRMPYIPTADVFVAEGLNKRATFFGCNETDTMFIVYLPNTDYVFASNVSTDQLAYTIEETTAMIDNGVAIATQNETEGWPFCLACGIMNKGENLPEGCDECFAEYCYYQ